MAVVGAFVSTTVILSHFLLLQIKLFEYLTGFIWYWSSPVLTAVT